jgi:hypothetical protein
MQHRLEALRQRHVHIELEKGALYMLVHVLDWVVVGHGTVIAENLGAEFLKFDPATRF